MRDATHPVWAPLPYMLLFRCSSCGLSNLTVLVDDEDIVIDYDFRRLGASRLMLCCCCCCRESTFEGCNV